VVAVVGVEEHQEELVLSVKMVQVVPQQEAVHVPIMVALNAGYTVTVLVDLIENYLLGKFVL